MKARLSVADSRAMLRNTLAALCVCAFGLAMLCAATPLWHDAQAAYADDLAAQSASPISYGGDAVTFVQADLSSEFGMFRNPSGDMSVSYEGGMVHISFTPRNQSVYKGFYLNASIDDRGTWNGGNFINAVGSAADQSLAYDFLIDAGYCGYAWPIAPIIADGRDNAGGTTGEQYYMTVPPLESIAGAFVTVTFTDGLGNVIGSSSMPSGEDAVPPADPVRDGYVFAGWDAPFTGVTQDITVNATWTVEPGVKAYTVTFVDGFGGVISSQLVREGYAAVPPADPVRDGFLFTGWKPDAFGNVTADLQVEAQWLDEALVSLEAVRASIAALPASPENLLRDTGNEAIASAATAYLALDSDLKAQLSDGERLHLAKCAIAVLPSDPFKVSSGHATPISIASDVVASLSDNERGVLDSETISSSRTYGRYLENAVWALDSLNGMSGVTMLQAGTYTGQVTSTSNMGKSDSRRAIGFTVTSISVKDGKATAIIEHGSNSSQTLKLGGVEYPNLQSDPAGKSFFEIPLSLNTTFHFSVKGKNATDETDAISYEMTVTADEASMTPDKGGVPSGARGSTSGGSGAKAGSGMNLNTLVSGGTSAASSSAAALSSSAGKRNAASSSAKRIGEVDLGVPAGGGAFEAGVDMGPAIAGCAMLFASAGVLAFTLRFLRRESLLPKHKAMAAHHLDVA